MHAEETMIMIMSTILIMIMTYGYDYKPSLPFFPPANDQIHLRAAQTADMDVHIPYPVVSAFQKASKEEFSPSPCLPMYRQVIM